MLGRAAFVAVVEATELGNRDDAAIGWRSHRPRDRRVFVERKMRSGVEVVLHVGVQDAAQPALSADDDVIEALAANGPDKSLDVRVGVSSRLHRRRAVRHKRFVLPIPSIHSVGGYFS